MAGFSLAEKGDVADFYRIDDRKAAREAPMKATEEERQSFKGLFSSLYVQGLEDTIKAFYGKLEELSLVESLMRLVACDCKMCSTMAAVVTSLAQCVIRRY
nr:hypothetical protein [Vibrio parahaemolyticus]